MEPISLRNLDSKPLFFKLLLELQASWHANPDWPIRLPRDRAQFSHALPRLCAERSSERAQRFFCARYASFLAQMVVIRRCNLSCGYCSEYDKFSDPVPAEVLEKGFLKLKELGTFGISLTGGDALYS